MRDLKELQEEINLFNKTRIPRCFTCKTVYKLIKDVGQERVWEQQCICPEQQKTIRLCCFGKKEVERGR